LRHLADAFEDVDFHIDDSPMSIHKLAVRGDQEERVEDLYIRERDGRQALLAHESAIIARIPKHVRTVRIFADAAPERRESIRQEIRRVETTI
jgi:hypothetical protein